MILRLPAAALMLAMAVAGSALAHGYKLGTLEIGHPWSRATAATAATGAAFMKITNTGATSDRLIAARSPAAASVEIHEMKMDGTIMRMRKLEEGLAVPAGGTVVLEPGGYHLMLIGLKEPLKEGIRVPMTIVFEKAGELDVELAITATAATPGHTRH